MKRIPQGEDLHGGEGVEDVAVVLHVPTESSIVTLAGQYPLN
jgi:hypothetical protein